MFNYSQHQGIINTLFRFKSQKAVKSKFDTVYLLLIALWQFNLNFIFLKEMLVANSAQARKRARQNTKRRQLKASQRSMVRTYIKRTIAAIEAKDYALATEAYNKAVPVIDRMADKGVMHKNKAARLKSRLNKAIKALQA